MRRMSTELASFVVCRSHVACMFLPLACGMHVWEAGGQASCSKHDVYPRTSLSMTAKQKSNDLPSALFLPRTGSDCTCEQRSKISTTV